MRPTCSNHPQSAAAPEPLSVVLTDSPRVVQLKREFFALDQREEDLKRDMGTVRDRKAAISREIFAPEHANAVPIQYKTSP